MTGTSSSFPPRASDRPDSKLATKRVLLAVIIVNTLTFFALALLDKLNVQGKALVYVDFWGRVTVYSLWFILYTLYRKVAYPILPLRALTIAIVVLNIPAFLLLAYFDKISNAPETLVYVDFWGRLTAYSVWFIAYEAYRVYLEDDRSVAAV